MVKGLDQLREYFKGYEKSYILIGGTACEIRIEGRGVPFRATRDIDMLLVIEALDKSFQEQFWKLIRDGGYTENYIDEQERKFFRFRNPQQEDFPDIIELFSRKPDNIELPEGFHLTPIPTDEEISSMSAMLLDEDYYNFTLQNCSNYDNLMVANERALVCLKVKAFLNNKARVEAGQQVRSSDIDKHKKDVLKLALTLVGEDSEKIEIPVSIKQDLQIFISLMQEEKIIVEHLANDFQVPGITLDEILEQIRMEFRLS